MVMIQSVTLMCDGDKSLVLKDKTITKIAKRNMNGIVPLAYELKKAKGGELNSDALYNGMIKAYTTGNIGPISNNITKIWNHDKITQKEIDVVKWLCFENNAVIDCAKTGWLPTRPTEIDKIIKSYTKAKVPYFFQFAKDKEPEQTERPNESAMNRLSAYIPDKRISYCKTIGKFDYRKLMNLDCGFDIREDSLIIERYEYYNQNKDKIFNIDDGKYLNQMDCYLPKFVRDKIIEETGCNLDYITNTLVVYFYTIKKNSNKELLWSSFGDVIVENLKKNVKGKICPICGKRFEPNSNRQLTCSEECGGLLDIQNKRKIRGTVIQGKP